MALTSYLTSLQNLLGTTAAGNLYTQSQLTGYINEARNQVAMDAQCVRVLPTIQGAITAITVSSGGTGWSNTQPPTVVISAPDSPSGFAPFPNGSQAVATCLVSAGAITSVTVTSGGAGYFQPLISFISGAGKSTIAFATTSLVNATLQGQEVYPFSGVNPLVAVSGSGVQQIIAVNSVNFIWGTFRYTLMVKSFSEYQAKVRTYTAGYQYIPAVLGQYGQGALGSLYLYPVANQAYQMEWDCFCQPQPLNTDTDVEAIPYPWTDVVKYYAAYLAYLGKGRIADAATMFNEGQQRPGLYQQHMARSRRQASPRQVVNWYGRG